MAGDGVGKLISLKVRPKWPEDNSNLTIILIRVTAAKTTLGIGNDD